MSQPDKEALLRHFQKDPILFAYHIGDLDDFFYSMCRWPVLHNDEGEIDEALLIYDHPRYPTVMAFGLSSRFDHFLENNLDQLPDQFYCHFRPPHEDIIRKKYTMNALGEHLKMKLISYRPGHRDDGKIELMPANDADKLEKFYEKAYEASYFDPRMLKTKKYFVYRRDGKIAGVAGIHVYSPKYKIAVLGNIATHPDFRGIGIATELTSYLTSELIKEDLTVCLNVKADNEPAIACYHRLGFEIVHNYWEAHFTKH